MVAHADVDRQVAPSAEVAASLKFWLSSPGVPTAVTHVVAAVSIGTVIVPGRTKLIALGAACAALPDADVIGLRLGIPYQHVLGHRGLSHSIAFALLLAALAIWLTQRRDAGHPPAARVGWLFFLATMSHGLLDALTDGGLGVAFFAPFQAERYFFPWRPIAVSPISIRRLLSGEGGAVVASELLIVWIPAALIAISAIWFRRRRAIATPGSPG